MEYKNDHKYKYQAKYLNITFFGTTYLCTIVFRTDTANIRKLVNFTYAQETRKLEFKKLGEISSLWTKFDPLITNIF